MQNPNEPSLHIGQRIRAELERQGRRSSWLAERLCYERSNIYGIFKRKSIDTDLLLRISQVLGTDFFSDYSRELAKKTSPQFADKSSTPVGTL